MTIQIARRTVDEIERHAAETYPRECCGVVVGDGARERVNRIDNIQDRMHADDPAAHPRDSRTAYFMDPEQLYAVMRDAERASAPVRVFYHSHPDHAAYFSDEDRARAMAWDEPAYPKAYYLVVSVVEGRVADRIMVRWDTDRREFVPTDVAVA